MFKDETICEAFMLVGELAYLRGSKGIASIPGLHTVKIDDNWVVKINPHLTEVEQVPPCEMMVEFNGWPAGLFNAKGGCIADGVAANEGELIAAINGAIDKEKEAANGDG